MMPFQMYLNKNHTNETIKRTTQICHGYLCATIAQALILRNLFTQHTYILLKEVWPPTINFHNWYCVKRDKYVNK